MLRQFRKDNGAVETGLEEAIRENSCPLRNESCLQRLFDRIGDARIVMLGEASHGTHEYYTMRMKLSKKLIQEKGFNFIAVEGDWPDCYKINRFVKGYEPPPPGEGALPLISSFRRWPTWMWANWETVALAEWLHAHNEGLATAKKAGFYGLDVYSLWESMESIMDYLAKNEPDSLSAAEDAFRCFEPFRQDEGQSYARASLLVPELCQEETIQLLHEIRLKAPQYPTDAENAFSAEQNAIVAVNAERYYRAMIRGGAESWNLRDRHMEETLERLLQFHGENSKAIIWAHNTHIGDARATDMAEEGMVNIGGLARQRYGSDDVVLVGFGSYGGTVMAGSQWGAPMQEMVVPEAPQGSWEYRLHQAGSDNKLLIMDDFRDCTPLEQPIGHRAIGVVYRPDREVPGNYVPSVIPERYDAFIYLDRTQALHALHNTPDATEIPDTYPFGT
jgi:erythromycin esterase